MKKGLVQVYTGEGKGKTTAAIGLAIRAAGHGLKVFICQFLKGRRTGEFILIKKALAGQIDIFQCGSEKFIITEEDKREHRETARRALEFSKKALVSKDYDLVILDEINVAVHLGLIDLKDVITIIESKPESVELVLTGRNAPSEIIERADLVTEMKEIKHPFKKGIGAREGIEF